MAELQSMAAFNHPPLDSNQIRTVRILPSSSIDDIHCVLEDYTLPILEDDIQPLQRQDSQALLESLESGSRDVYIAISYQWCDPTPCHSITLNGARFPVAENLYSFLKCVNRTEDIGLSRLWIDAICINQSDIAEKSEQVHQIWRVFAHAAITLSWLGPEQDYTADAFEALNTDPIETVNALLKSANNDELRKQRDAVEARQDQAVAQLLDNPYFSRMWIVPEILSSTSEIVIMSGLHLASFSSLIARLNHSWTDSTEVTDPNLKHPFAAVLAKTMSREIFGDYYGRAMHLNIRPPAPFADALQYCCENYPLHKCSDPRDKIFAMLGHPNFRRDTALPRLTPDYSMDLNALAAALVSRCPGPSGGLNIGAWASGLLLGVSVGSDEFGAWLKEHVTHDDDREIDIIRLPSGRYIDCSGTGIQHLMHCTRLTCEKIIQGYQCDLHLNPEEFVSQEAALDPI